MNALKPATNPEQTAESTPVECLPIRMMATLTGINPVTLQTRERRYRLIRPVRTDSGHRLYTWEDIDSTQKTRGMLDKDLQIIRKYLHNYPGHRRATTDRKRDGLL
jgi:DNA-binding transcriptional MerR regulator